MFDRLDLFEDMKEEREMEEDARIFFEEGKALLAEAKLIQRKDSKLDAPEEIELKGHGEDVYYQAINFKSQAKAFWEAVEEENLDELE